MNSEDTRERKRLIMTRRIRQVCEQFGLPIPNRQRMYRLSNRAVDMLGEDGLNNIDLRVLVRLTNRGLFDNQAGAQS